MVGVVGVTWMELSDAVLTTVRIVDPVIVPTVAEILVVPKANKVAFPPATMVATAVSDELQVTDAVRF
jgi:hypothetical protein